VLALLLIVIRISYQNLLAGKRIIPFLAIAIERAVAKDLDVLAAPHPEGDGLLEIVVEIVGLPVGDVIGELHRSDH
jgi:hypothetical protein